MSREALDAKVIAVNRANKRANELYRELAPIFEKLVGTQVFKQDGTLMKKVEALLPSMPYTNPLHIYFHRSEYSLAWTVKSCQSLASGQSCTYHEVTVYIGSVRGGILNEISKPQDYRDDYDAATVADLRKVYEAKKKEADDARSALHPFGEYDR